MAVPRSVDTAGSPFQSGLSLVHPSLPDVEVTTPWGVGTGQHMLVSGLVSTAASVSNVTPVALLYLVNGDLKRIPLTASGASPLEAVKSAGASTLCHFVASADDYENVNSSRYIVSTSSAGVSQGAYGQTLCSEDGWAEITFDSEGTPLVKPLVTVAHGLQPSYAASWVLGILRDPVTSKPNAWVQSNGIQFWDGRGFMRMRPDDRAFAVPTSLVEQLPGAVVIAENGDSVRLWDATGRDQLLWSRPQSGSALTLPARVGFDANNLYLADRDGTWALLKINRSTFAVETLMQRSRTPSETAAAFSMGRNALYAVFNGRELWRVAKAGGIPAQPVTTVTEGGLQLQMSGAGAYLVRKTGGAHVSVDIVSEDGPTLYASGPGGAQPDTLSDDMTVFKRIDLQNSENRSQFVFATGYDAGSAAPTYRRGTLFAGSMLTVYDTVTGSIRLLGALPGVDAFPGVSGGAAGVGVLLANTDLSVGAGMVYPTAVGVASPCPSGDPAVCEFHVARPANARALSFAKDVTGSARVTDSTR
ncbi:MAG: hypothetical protein KF686_09425 [Ramlibacter sp.]|nr:hypothetical protein [Ramlibacter sp.]